MRYTTYFTIIKHIESGYINSIVVNVPPQSSTNMEVLSYIPPYLLHDNDYQNLKGTYIIDHFPNRSRVIWPHVFNLLCCLFMYLYVCEDFHNLCFACYVMLCYVILFFYTHTPPPYLVSDKKKCYVMLCCLDSIKYFDIYIFFSLNLIY